jgi:hypothetical protein
VARCYLTPILRGVAAECGLVPEAYEDVWAAVRDSYLLRSLPGCKIGKLHRDMPSAGDKNYDGLAVGMIAIGNNTRLWVVEGSHRLTDVKGLNVEQLTLVEIPIGCTLFLHALTAHAGDDETVSDRVHFYVDPYKAGGRLLKSAPYGSRLPNDKGSGDVRFSEGTTPSFFPDHP